MRSYLKSMILGIALAVGVMPLAAPGGANAQTTKQSVQGTWVNHTGASRAEMRFFGDGTYSIVYEDIQGRRLQDSGRYIVASQTVLTTSTDGTGSRLYFFWNSPTSATIRVVPDAAPHRHVDATFVRVSGAGK